MKVDDAIRALQDFPWRNTGHTLLQRFRDSGNGVPAEMIERIYEAFYSTKSEGMGIGLKLCRSIVESHHGRMQVQNIYNGEEVVGCCFSFWIPVQSRLTQEPEPGASAATSLTDIERAR